MNELELPWYHRTEIQIGNENIKKLQQSHVLIAGLGGVGSYVAELICRAGVGNLTIVDNDVVNKTNLNRQLPALIDTIGKNKTDVMAERLLQINPNLNLNKKQVYLKDEVIYNVLDDNFNYIVDAIDSLSPKVFFLLHAKKRGFPIISSMGAGGKYFPSLIKVADISESYNCRLAYYIRKKLHKLGIENGIKVVFSTEMVADSAIMKGSSDKNKRSTVGTLSYMPAMFGCYCASTVICDLLSINEK